MLKKLQFVSLLIFFIGELTIYGSRNVDVMSCFFLAYSEFLPQFLWLLSYFFFCPIVLFIFFSFVCGLSFPLSCSYFVAFFLLNCCLKSPFTDLGISYSNTCQHGFFYPHPQPKAHKAEVKGIEVIMSEKRNQMSEIM